MVVQAEGGRRNSGISRRDFLKYSFSTGVVIWTGSQIPRGLIDEAEAQALFNVKPGDPATVFPQSVASGDPQPNGIVLWTRVASLKQPAGSTVSYEVARDTTFRKPVLRGTAQTSAEKDNTVKVQINRTELSPFTTYYYRFIYNGTASRIGRFKTLPAADGAVDRVRFGYISCQDYTNGYYNALSFLSEENIDFVVHLGDYIYETTDDANFQNGQARSITLPAGSNDGDPKEADTLNDYRFLYKTYKSDRDLQKVHERFAMIAIWDDHEFGNDCYQTVAPDAATETTPVPQRREAANQAWAEYIPAGVPYSPAAGPLEEIQIYRSFAFGNLMDLVMTDERLYRDGPPAGNELQDRYLTPGGKGEDLPSRTILGLSPDGSKQTRPQQKQFFLDRMLGSTRKWKLWGNEVTFMQFKVLNTYLQSFSEVPGGGTILPDPLTDGVYVTLDQWDGFQAERDQIIEEIGTRGVKNFVTLTGDIHTFIAGYIRRDFNDPTSVPQNTPGALPPPDAVGVELVCGSVTSANLTELATFGQGRAGIPGEPGTPERRDASEIFQVSNNRHFKYFNSDTHGYNIIDVTSQKLTCTMKAVSTIKSPQATLSTLKVFEVPAGRVELRDVTPA